MGKVIGLEYVQTNEQGIQHANNTRSSPQAAFESLSSCSWNDLGGEGEADVAQRIHSEAESLVKWAREYSWLRSESWLNIVPD